MENCKNSGGLLRLRPNLAKELLPLYETAKSKTDQMIEARTLGEALAERKILLDDPIAAALAATKNINRLLLVVDQFEELFTLSEDRCRQPRRLFSDTCAVCGLCGRLCCLCDACCAPMSSWFRIPLLGIRSMRLDTPFEGGRHCISLEFNQEAETILTNRAEWNPMPR